ncbi:phosphoglycerate dehydrogenase [Paracoccidioides brasiliensis Pb18]|uniref:D-3-phosphoglycerate dehydrogenase n=1 Tax=Paracoccidioides brasiliensis (strain Pb18) TaxID=502780 RepID=C1GN15_PARBD|nr:phosphoglycerate dehydrogenase [Paracoccidioides brasiliensis Pb18]EEH45017.2 phosphoglycerate dehydrogenase [Paracoccidioides brasiliensis Pb18]
MPLLSENGVPAKVLVPENLSPDGLALLRTTLDVHEKRGLSPEELLRIIPDYQALLIRSETKVTAEVLRAGKNLKVVARAGVGVDNVDVPTATKLGIVVINSPSGNVGAAAEHTIALMLSMARNISEGCSILKAGKWERSRLVGVEVKGKTLGIIGLGKVFIPVVGLIVARLAKGLGMKVNAVDPYASPAVAESASVNLFPSLAALLPTVDFLTIHTPLLASTKGMISSAEISQMKRGARILNVARGGTVDEVALLEALESGQLAAAAVDVFTSEPPLADSSASKLIAHPRVVATPHLGASTVEAQENVSIDVCEQVLHILGGALPRSAVNAPLILPEEYKKLQPFVHLVEKMGSLYTQHYTSSSTYTANSTAFDLIYEGEISGINNTKPLFAALVKGLIAPISNTAGVNVNIVNAELIARERGIVVNEQFSRDPALHSYSSLITLAARPPSRPSSRPPPGETISVSSAKLVPEQQQIISGTCSQSQPLISRLGRFTTSFAPEGTLLICHNYDSPGKIGVVGSILGKEGVNINFMGVAPVSKSLLVAPTNKSLGEVKAGLDETGSYEPEKEALMILGVDRTVEDNVVKALVEEGGALSVSVLSL